MGVDSFKKIIMNTEAWIEPLYQPIHHIGDPNEMIVKAEFAYTTIQRAWYMRVYGGRCVFPMSKDDGRLVYCGSDNKIEIHHVLPSQMIMSQEPWTDPNELDIDRRHVGLALCQMHHHTIHPDIRDAFIHYGEDKKGIKRAVHEHKVLADQGIVFWDDSYDEALVAIATRHIQKYMREYPDDPYPVDRRWAKGNHPNSFWDRIFPKGGYYEQ